MTRYTATEAKNRFGALCLQAKAGPIVVEKSGQPDTVLLSYADYQRLTASPALRSRRKQFNEQYGEWIALQNQQVEEHGLWNDDLRTW